MCSRPIKRTVRGWPTGLCCLFVAVVGQQVRAADPPKGEVTLTVAASATTICAGDPLILKGVLRNGTAKAAWLPRRFESESGNVRVEVCPPDAKEFREAKTLDPWFLVKNHYRPVWLEAGKEVVCYARTFDQFQTPGKWQVRLTARVDGDGITSPAVTVLVTERTEKAQRVLERYESAIRACLNRYGWIEAADLEKALEAREWLGTSEAAGAITQAQLLHSLSTAGSAKAHALTVDALKKHRDGLSPVWREFLDLRTARVLFDQKKYDAAEALLKEIKEPSTDRDFVLVGLRAVREDKSIPAPRPVKP